MLLNALEKERKKQLKALKDVEKLEQLARGGTKLELNQKAKVADKKGCKAALEAAERALEAAVLKASKVDREACGRCGNCGSSGHKTSNCPRPKMKTAASEAGKTKTAGGSSGAGGATKTKKAAAPFAGAAVKCLNCGAVGHTTANCPRTKTAELKLYEANRAKLAAEKAAAKARAHKAAEQERWLAGAAATAATTRDTGAGAAGAAPVVHSESVGSVLVVAEKPSIAKAIAHAMSGGRMRTRGNADGWAQMCRLHDFYTYFGPARGKCRSSSHCLPTHA